MVVGFIISSKKVLIRVGQENIEEIKGRITQRLYGGLLTVLQPILKNNWRDSRNYAKCKKRG